MSTKKALFLVGGLLLLAAFLVACGPKPTPTPTEVPTAEPTPTEIPLEVPYEGAWSGSGHADVEAEAFIHWNEEDPAEIPTSCAKCHSSAGYQDFLGADGSEAGKVDAAVPAVGNPGILCVACHNPVTMTKTSVVFPSGVEVTGAGDAARCMECHQGRESKVSVDKQIADFNAAEALDAVPAPITDASGNQRTFGFRNIHYFPAAATLYGSTVHGGYEYDGKIYDIKNAHVEGYDTCTACHDPHTLQVKVEQCAFCHEGVASVEDLKNVRMVSSAMDYDGDGNVEEGMYYEIETLQTTLYAAMQSYAATTTGGSLVYDAAAYPYFFADNDGDGAADQGDSGAVRFTNWTPRLLKAAYNYQLSIKDPGAFAHGNKYIVQLLCDSIEDVSGTGCAQRDDAGHFAGSTMPFRDWDEAGMVPFGCVKCHTAEGLPTFIRDGGSVVVTSTGTTVTTGLAWLPPSNGFMCSTCHDEANWPNRYAVASVTFPSGKTVSLGGKDADGKFVAVDANLCILCHMGRESTTSVNNALKGKEADTVDAKISFKNIHYFAAGATLFGNDVQGAYQYDGKTYVGLSTHPVNKCTDCHEVHSLEPKVETCAVCHGGVTDPEAIRMTAPDYDGDGNTTEGVAGEIETLTEALYAEIQKYAEAHGGAITYDAGAYPYFFGADGKRYAAWTPRLLKAAFNYQYAHKDPGAFVHNPKYVVQFLIDSIKDLGGDVTGYTRP